jgi:hypothetical protein
VFGAGQPNETTLYGYPGHDTSFLARYSGDGVFDWAQIVGGSGDVSLRCRATWRPTGETVLWGVFAGSAVFDEGGPNETAIDSLGGGDDLFLASYRPDGELSWAVAAGGQDGCTMGEQMIDLAVLNDGSVVVTGSYCHAATFGAGTPAETIVSSGEGSNGYVARYSGDGALEWVKSFGGNGWSDGNSGLAATVDEDGVLVAGTVGNGTVVFGAFETNQTVLQLFDPQTFFVARFFLDDGRLDWVGTAPDSASMTPRAIVRLPDGRVAVTGVHSWINTLGVDEDGALVSCDSGGNENYPRSRPFLAVYSDL